MIYTEVMKFTYYSLYCESNARDLPIIWADISKAKNELGLPSSHSIYDKCKDTWNWQSRIKGFNP